MAFDCFEYVYFLSCFSFRFRWMCDNVLCSLHVWLTEGIRCVFFKTRFHSSHIPGLYMYIRRSRHIKCTSTHLGRIFLSCYQSSQWVTLFFLFLMYHYYMQIPFLLFLACRKWIHVHSQEDNVRIKIQTHTPSGYIHCTYIHINVRFKQPEIMPSAFYFHFL